MTDGAHGAVGVGSETLGGFASVAVGLLNHVGFDLIEPGEKELRFVHVIAASQSNALLNELVARLHCALHLQDLRAAEKNSDTRLVAKRTLRLVEIARGILRVVNLGWSIRNLGLLESAFGEELINCLPGSLNLPLELREIILRDRERDGPD